MKKLLKSWWYWIEGIWLGWYIRLVSHTANMHIEGEHFKQQAEASGRPIIYATWHQQVKTFLQYGMRHLLPADRFVAIIVGDERGDILHHMGQNLGGIPIKVDMQGNPVAAGRTVLNLIKVLRGEGKYTFLAPDGPDGPAFQLKPGLSFLARKAKAAVIPFGAYTLSGYQMDRWDKYLLPYPFCDLYIVMGEPIYVEAKADVAELEKRFAAALHKVRDRARLLAGEKVS